MRIRCVCPDCQPDPCFGVDCGGGMRCVEGLCAHSGLDAGRRDAGELRMDAGPRENPNASGCGCRAGRSGPGLVLGGLLALVVLLARRR